MKIGRVVVVATSVVFLFSAAPVMAERPHGGPMMKHHGKMESKPCDHGAHGMGHLMGGNWRMSLSDDQKGQIDKMHLELKKRIKLFKAQKAVKKAELNNLITEEHPNRKAIEEKIEEVLAIKREIMRAKADHKVEMRQAMTPEQRTSFDMHLLEEKKHHKGKKGHR